MRGLVPGAAEISQELYMDGARERERKRETRDKREAERGEG